MTLYADADEDGFGDPEVSMQACEAQDGYVTEDGDCDDDNDQVYPGADEVCDSLDNDCDDATDEYSVTNTESCEGCKMEPGDKSVLYFCAGPAGWNNARELCLQKGADLVSINDSTELDAVWTVLKPVGKAYWLGASDIENEGAYVWLDGTNLSAFDSNWAQGQPLEERGLDCVALNKSSRYAMRPCDPGLPWVCEGPLQ